MPIPPPLTKMVLNTAESEAVGMKISTSNSKPMVLNRKKVEGPLRIGDKMLPQVEVVSSISRCCLRIRGKMESEIGAVKWALFGS